MRFYQFACFAVLSLLASAWARAVVVDVDLPHLIDQQVNHPNRFAVDIPYRIRAETTGTWTASPSGQIWRYSVQVPTAVSMGFFADHVNLPASATLTVSAHGIVYTYRPSDIRRGTLWSRIARGDQLDFQLTVSAADRPNVQFDIASVQAGYRSLERGGINHPHYNQMRRLNEAAAPATCVENYECDADASNQGPGQASVALIIGNIGQCSGTLLNDAPSDGTPYVLTARHCENDTLGGGAPENAADVSVYWDVTSPCGQVLGSIYNPGVAVQAGATSITEQQDAWLIKLDESPTVSDAYFAGWSAATTTIDGGYTIQQAESGAKQYTGWFGPAISLTVPGTQLDNLPYASNFLGVVNQLGSVAPGASGSALFDGNGLLRGSLSLGILQDGSGVCPATSPAVPTTSNVVAEFTAFASVFASTADSTETGVTLQRALDPLLSGVTSVTGANGGGVVSLTASTTFPTVGTSAILTWSAPTATSCTASGGFPGDGWSGTLPPSGNLPVNEANPIALTYSIRCSVGTMGLTSQLQLTWASNGQLPGVGMDLSRRDQWVGGAVSISWFGNISNCTLTGGGLNVTGLPSSGTYSASENAAGTYQFTVTCGSGSQTYQATQTATFTPPSVTLSAATQRLVGEAFTISYDTAADNCVPSGGGTDPDWTANDIVGSSSLVWLNEKSPGTFTYTLTCTSASVTAQGSVTVDVVTGDPAVTLTAVSGTSIPFGNPITLTWSSNVDNCLESESSANPSGQFNSGVPPDGTQVIQQPSQGTHIYTMTCGNAFGFGPAQAQVTVTVTPSTTTDSLTASATQVAPGQSFTLTWASTNAFGCIGAGAVEDVQWNNYGAPNGTMTLSESIPGTYIYTKTCSAGTQSATAQVTVTVGSQSAGGGSGGTGSSGGGGGGLALPDLIGLMSCWLIGRQRRVILRLKTAVAA